MGDTMDFPPSRKAEVRRAVEAVLTPEVFLPWSQFVARLTSARTALATLRERRAAESAAWMKARKEGRETILDASSPKEKVEAFHEKFRRQNAEGAEAHRVAQREAGVIAVEAIQHGTIVVRPRIIGARHVVGRDGRFDVITDEGLVDTTEHFVELARTAATQGAKGGQKRAAGHPVELKPEAEGGASGKQRRPKAARLRNRMLDAMRQLGNGFSKLERKEVAAAVGRALGKRHTGLTADNGTFKLAYADREKEIASEL
jgi:hypothetical protein